MKKYTIFACLFFTIFANTTFASSITNGKVYMIIEIEIKDNESRQNLADLRSTINEKFIP